MSHWVYILYSESTDSYYKGQTDDLHKRIRRHNKGWEKATQNGIPWKIVWCTEKESKSSAMILERKLKNLSRSKLIRFMEKYSEGSGATDVTPKA